MKNKNSWKIFKKLTACSIAMIMCMLTGLTPIGVSAANDIFVPATFYTEAYNATNSSSSLDVDSTGLILRQGDWAKYGITVAEAGVYDVSITVLVDGTRNQNYTVSLDDETKLSDAEVLVEAGGWVECKLGTINITKTGAQTLKIENTGFWSYVQSLKLTYVAELNYDIEIPVTSYKEGYKASDGSGTLTTDGAALVLSNGDWGKYDIEVLKEGQYKVSLDALVDGTRNQGFAISLDDVAKLSNSEVPVEAGGWKTCEIGIINITKTGTHTFKLESTGTYWTYAKNLKLTYVGELDLDIEIPVTTYKEGYKASDGSGALTTDGAALVLNNGDWAKYDIEVLKAGQYKVTMDALIDGTRNQNYAISIDGVTKLPNAEVLVEAGDWRTCELGTISIAKDGIQTLKIENIGYWSYVQNLKLTYVGELNYDIEIPVTTYKEGYAASSGGSTLTTEGSALILYAGDWAKYDIEVLKAGQYKVTADALVDGTRTQNFSVWVDDAVKLDNAGVMVETGGWKTCEIGTVNITKEGVQTLKIANSGQFWTYAQNLKLTYVGELDYDIEIPVTTYKEGYAASSGGSTLATEGSALILYAGDWAKYDIEVLKAGQYKVTADALVDGTRTQNFSVWVDDAVKLDNAGVMVEAGGWKTCEIGTVNITKEGVQTLKIANSGQYWTYAQNLKLTYVGELDYDIAIPVTAYKEGYAASNGGSTLTAAGEAVIFYQNDWAKYDIEVLKAGKYTVTTEILVDADRPQQYIISADNCLKNLNSDVVATAGGFKEYTLGTIGFAEDGLQTLKLENTSFWAYVQNLKLTYAGDIEMTAAGTTVAAEIAAENYFDGYDISEASYDMTIVNGNVAFGNGDYVEYIIDAETAGVYNAKTEAIFGDGVSSGTIDVLADGTAYSRESLEEADSTADNYICLDKGINILRLENPGETEYYLSSINISYCSDITNVQSEDVSVGAVIPDANAEGDRIAFGINAANDGVYKFNISAKSTDGAELNVYANDALVSVVTVRDSETIADYYSMARLKSGNNIIKIKVISGNVNISDVIAGFASSATDEELDELAKSVQNAADEEEIKNILSADASLIGADIDELVSGIQYDNYVFIRLVGKTFTDGVELIETVYNTVALEKARPSLTTSVSDKVYTVLAETDIYESDGIFITALYKGGRMIGMNFDPFARGEMAEVNVSGYEEGCTVKIFCVDSLDNIKPVNISGGVYENIYVSSYASANGDGTELNPYRSFSEAKARVAELKNSQSGDIVVNIMPGYYELDETEVFTENDGASGDNKIIYKGTDAENMPIISGGKKVTGWTHEGNGIYSASFSGGAVRNLYVGGYPAQRARSNSTYSLSSKNGNVMTATVSDISSFVKPSDLVLVWPCEWATHYTPVSDVSMSNGTATFTMGETFVWTTGEDYTDIGGYYSKLFFIENALELLDTEGEFYYDAEAEKIYYKPFAEEDLNDCYVSQIDGMLEIAGTSEENKVSNIVFENLDFRYGTWNNNGIKHIQSDQYILNETEVGDEYAHIPAQIEINYADNIKFANCRFSCLGSTAISMRESVTNSSVSGNVFKDLGGGAISIGSFNHELVTAEGNRCSGIKFTDNVVRRTSQVYYGVPSVTIYYESNIDVVCNDIADVPYTAISAGWGWGMSDANMKNLTISKNRIFNVMKTLNDGAHIYTLGNMPGTVIKENYMYKTGDGRGGVYNDTGSAGISILDNVIDIYNSSKNTYWWTQGMYAIHDIYAEGNFAHSNGIYESDNGERVTHSDNNNIAAAGSWDGSGDETAQAIIDNAGVGNWFKSLLDLADVPSWRNDPTEMTFDKPE